MNLHHPNNNTPSPTTTSSSLGPGGGGVAMVRDVSIGSSTDSLNYNCTTPKSWEMNLKEYIPNHHQNDDNNNNLNGYGGSSAYVNGGEYLRPLALQQQQQQQQLKQSQQYYPNSYMSRARTVSTDEPTNHDQDEIYNALSKSLQPQDLLLPKQRRQQEHEQQRQQQQQQQQQIRREISESDLDALEDPPIDPLLNETNHSYVPSLPNITPTSPSQKKYGINNINNNDHYHHQNSEGNGSGVGIGRAIQGEESLDVALRRSRRRNTVNNFITSNNHNNKGRNGNSRGSNGDSAVRGGKVFIPVFGRNSKKNTTNSSNGGSGFSMDTSNRKIRSCGALDSTVRGGHEVIHRRNYSRSMLTGPMGELSVRNGGLFYGNTGGIGGSGDVGVGSVGGSSGIRGMVVGGPPSSSSNNSTSTPFSTQHNNMTRDKRIFYTKVHNSSTNSTEAYLGDDKSVSRGKLTPNGKNTTTANNNTSIRSSYSNLPPVTELNKDIILNPVEGIEVRSGRGEFFFAPVILATCRCELLEDLWKQSLNRADDGDADGSDGVVVGSNDSLIPSHSSLPHHGMVLLGEAIVNEHGPYTNNNGGSATTTTTTTQGTNNKNKSISLSTTSSSSSQQKQPMHAWFVIRQNFLLEYEDVSDMDHGQRPRGFAFLQGSTVKDVSEEYGMDGMTQLDYLVDPIVGKRKSIVIRAVKPDEKRRWISLFREASQLSIDDLYEYDESQVLKELRYATIQPARRRHTGITHQSNSTTYKASTSTTTPSTPITIEHGGIMKKTPSFSLSNNNTINPTSKNSSKTRLAMEECDCALKIMDKQKFWNLVRKKKERGDAIVREVTVQSSLTFQCQHIPGLLRMKSFFETRDKVILELELIQHTNLFHHVQSKGTLGESEAAQIMHDLLTCIVAMGENGVAHRDIKPQNILMADQNSNKEGVNIKLGDFGNAAFVEKSDNRVYGQCGTAGFVAPEILLNKHRGYENKVDIFSAGVTLYLILCGYEPFYGENEAELIQNNREGRIKFDENDWRPESISVEGRDLVERMLQKDPMKRITAEQALNHAWIRRRYTALPTTSLKTKSTDSCAIS